MAEIALPNVLKTFRSDALRDPTDPLSFYLAALDCHDRGDIDGWKQAVGTALSLPHLTPQQRYNRAAAKIALGDWSGWREYDDRLLQPEAPSEYGMLLNWIRWTHRAWDGVEDIQEQTLLVLPEQGAGDTIQVLRFIPWLIERAQHVIVMAYPRLVPLVQHNFGDRAEIAIQGTNEPIRFDQYVMSMSLPGLYGRVPPFVPLRAPGRRPPLKPSTHLRGGICWAGNPMYGDDSLRSMPIETVAPLFTRRDVEWYSLQIGDRAFEADAYSSCVKPWPSLITFADTADLMMDLDFTLSVDTATAHLAGCLGKPTWLMLPYRSDPRWGIDQRTTTPWYPTMRLLRQREPGNWSNVIAEVMRSLDDADFEAQVVMAPSPVTHQSE